ncbi:hypothetical protein ACEK07_29445, partial [Alcanivoracaceae bacterium MT1]
KDSIHILMEGVPTHIKVNDVQKMLTSIKNVVGVHDLHVWAISSDIPSLSCHILIKDAQFSQEVLKDAKHLLHEKFDIEHTTIQIDTPEIQCEIKEH